MLGCARMGKKGLLVNTLKVYEDYYRQRAQLWEIQSLSRSRAMAGDARVGRAIHKPGGGPDELSGRRACRWRHIRLIGKRRSVRCACGFEKERTPAWQRGPGD